MRYLGGKWRIRNWVTETLLTQRARTTTYLEPFMGSAAVFHIMAPHYPGAAIGADAHPDLMMMWQAVQRGWVPPAYVDQDTVATYRDKPPSAMRGFVGFGASYRGLWFHSAEGGKHIRRPNDKPNIVAAAASLNYKRPSLRGAVLLRADYANHAPKDGWLVYCDPPYQGTAGYVTGDFDHARFYETMREWVTAGALVLVSEQTAPLGWVPIRVRSRAHLLAPRTDRGVARRPEGLWVPKSQQYLWPRFDDTP